MRALLYLIALTFCLVGGYPRIGDNSASRTKKEYGKDSPLDEEDYRHTREDGKIRDDEENYEDEEDGIGGDDVVKETSVRKKHFMDQYYLQSGPVKYEFGHVSEDPDDWQNRYEKRDFGKNRHQGQVKWGDANGGQGEQLWDFNHGGRDFDEDDDFGGDKKKSDDHRFKRPKEKIRIKEKVIEKTTDGGNSREFSRSKTGTTTYDNNEGGQYEKRVTNKKTNDDIPFLFDPVGFDSDRFSTGRGFSQDDFEFDNHDSFERDFDIDRIGLLAPSKDADLTKKNKQTDEGKSKGVRQGFVTVEESVRRIDTLPSTTKTKRDSGKKFSVEEHKEIRKYDLFPSALLKSMQSAQDTEPGASKNVRVKKLSPVSGSLTDKNTGRTLKIYGILVDS